MLNSLPKTPRFDKIFAMVLGPFLIEIFIFEAIRRLMAESAGF